MAALYMNQSVFPHTVRSTNPVAIQAPELACARLRFASGWGMAGCWMKKI